jgi:hypothetical protein
MSSAERTRAFRARQKAIATREPDLASSRERIRALESDLAAARAEAHSLRAQLATQQDLEATVARHQAVASSALFLLSVLLHDGCSPMGTPRTSASGDVAGG